MNKEILNVNKEALSSSKRIIEFEKKTSIGTILAIVGIDPNRNGENLSNPLLWTTIEEQSKSVTDRIKGQISLPADTRKIGEDVIHNVIGSLAEFSDNEYLIREALSFVPSSFPEKKIFVKGNSVDLVVLVFNGSLNSQISPFDSDEVSPNRWMSIDELKKEKPSNLRSFVKDIIAMEDGIDKPIRRVVSDYFQLEHARIPLFSILPSGFSMVDFYAQRERLVDVAK